MKMREKRRNNILKLIFGKVNVNSETICLYVNHYYWLRKNRRVVQYHIAKYGVARYDRQAEGKE
jgi:hypothetical protein